MKPDLHPTIRPVIFEDTVTGGRFKILSAISTQETCTIGGEEFPLFKIDVTSTSHPFYTGQQRLLDTAGRVEKFGKKFSGLKAGSLLKKKA